MGDNAREIGCAGPLPEVEMLFSFRYALKTMSVFIIRRVCRVILVCAKALSRARASARGAKI